jgi:hypothetical protein
MHTQIPKLFRGGLTICRWRSCATLAATAVVAAFALAVGSAGPVGSPASGPRFTAIQRQELAALTPAQRMAFDHVAVVAFSRGGAEAGTGTMPTPGQPILAAQSWSWGHTGTHLWVIMTYTDVHNGALAGMVADCLAMIKIARLPGLLNRLCGALAGTLTHYSNGYVPMNNHGVWAAIYWWPPGLVDGGRW